jgi:hypothetical protein
MSVDEIQEALLESLSTDGIVGIFNDNFDTTSKKEKRVLKSDDDEAISELVAASIHSALNADLSGSDASEEELEELGSDLESFEDETESDVSEEDENETESDVSEEDEAGEAEDVVLEDGRILLAEEVDEDDIDAIADCLKGHVKPSKLTLIG